MQFGCWIIYEMMPIQVFINFYYQILKTWCRTESLPDQFNLFFIFKHFSLLFTDHKFSFLFIQRNFTGIQPNRYVGSLIYIKRIGESQGFPYWEETPRSKLMPLMGHAPPIYKLSPPTEKQAPFQEMIPRRRNGNCH